MKIIIATAAATLVALLGAGQASAGEIHRHGYVWGPHGWTKVHTERYCYDGECGYERSVTGPYGNTVQRAGTIEQVAPGVYERNRYVTGPAGNTVHRSKTITVTR